jgi:hypothetical protein
MKPTALEISIATPYSDKIDLIQKSLEIYKLLTGVHLTKRDKDILTMCFLYDINDDDFNEKVTRANIGIESVENINVLKHRMKLKGFLTQDPLKMSKKYLEPGLQNLKNAIMKNENITFNLMYAKG